MEGADGAKAMTPTERRMFRLALIGTGMALAMGILVGVSWASLLNLRICP